MSDDTVSTIMMAMPRKKPVRRVHPVQPMAQAMELVDRFRRAQVMHGLKPGMLCVEKRGLGHFTDTPVLMLWRMLDPEDWLDRKIMTDCVHAKSVNRIDCIVARLSDDSNYIIHLPHHLECLEPYHDSVEAEPIPSVTPRSDRRKRVPSSS